MASRPRRAAAQKANTAITDMVDSDNHTNSRTGRTMSSRASRRSEVKLPSSKLRQATSSGLTAAQSGRQSARDGFSGGEIVAGRRSRAQKKSYVVESSDDDDDEDEDEEEAEAEVDDDDDDDEDDDDAEGEDDDMADAPGEDEIVVNDDMDVDAEGDDDDEEEDAEGEDDDMDDTVPLPAPTIKVSKPATKSGGASKSRPAARASAKSAVPQARDSDDDEELSDLESEADEIQDTIKISGGGADDEDAEGEDEEIEDAEDAEAEAEVEAEVEASSAAQGAEENLDSGDETGSRAETPDLTKMTKRQRARFEEGGELMKLSDEVQAKKHFTAEELSMRRAEMARRRRNLSDKRNEEVKMETINKLLKKQAPKTNRKSQLALEASPDAEGNKPSPVFVRWTNTREGSVVAVPDELLRGPAGRVFVPGGLGRGKMVEEVS